MVHLRYLVVFHLKVIICYNVTLPHTYGCHLKKFNLWDNNYQKKIHGSQNYFNHMDSQCLVNTTNFI
jgi:hypothetical protein